VSSSPTRITSPPLPPSPPFGPPQGSYFSRRKLMQPRPPSPAAALMTHSSMNIGAGSCRIHRGCQGVESSTARKGPPTPGQRPPPTPTSNLSPAPPPRPLARLDRDLNPLAQVSRHVEILPFEQIAIRPLKVTAALHQPLKEELILRRLGGCAPAWTHWRVTQCKRSPPRPPESARGAPLSAFTSGVGAGRDAAPPPGAAAPRARRCRSSRAHRPPRGPASPRRSPRP
jgi:hypothetical protein